MTTDDLRVWAEAHGTGPVVMPQAAAVLELIKDNERLKRWEFTAEEYRSLLQHMQDQHQYQQGDAP